MAIPNELEGEIDAPERQHQANANSVQSNSLVRVRGRVIDDLFETPVAAWIGYATGPGAMSSAWDGSFELIVASEGELQARFLARHYKEVVRILIGDRSQSEVTIRMVPETPSSIIVSSEDGRPVGLLDVTWRAAIDHPERSQISDWVSSRKMVTGAEFRGKTNSTGVCSLSIATPVLATVLDPQHGVRKTVLVHPGESIPVRLTSSIVDILLVSQESHEPLKQFEVDYWFPCESAAMSQSAVSDDAGTVRLPVSSLPLLIRRPGSALWQTELLPVSAELSQVGTGGDLKTMLRMDSMPRESRATVMVRRFGGSLILIDQFSGAPVTSPVRLERRERTCPIDGTIPNVCTVLGRSSPIHNPDELYQSPQGRIDLPGLVMNSKSEGKLLILAEGYEPAEVDQSVLPRTAAGSPPVVEMKPAAGRCKALVLQSDGTPYAEPVTIYSPRFDTIVWASRGSPNGIHGEFDWYGGNLTAILGNGETQRLVTTQELAGGETIQISAETGLGSIAVEGIPSPELTANLIVKSGVGVSGVVYHPSRFDRQKCYFDSLPVGTYMVGPESWVLGAELQSMTFSTKRGAIPSQTRTVVVSGAESVVGWSDLWTARTSIKGEVRIQGYPVDRVLLIPLYGNSGPDGELLPAGIPSIVFGRRSPRLALDMDGAYDIRPSDPVPLLVVACTIHEGLWGTVGDLYVHDTLLPGESIDAKTASLQLSWSGKELRPNVSLELRALPASYRFPIQSPHSAMTRLWTVADPLTMSSIPVSITQIRVGRVWHPLMLREGKTTRIVCGIGADGGVAVLSTSIE